MSTDVDARPGEQDATGIGRFQRRTVLGGAALLIGAVPFLLSWMLVQRSWSPLAALDGEVATALNAEVRDAPVVVSLLRVVTDLGGAGTAVLVLTLTTAFLLIRGQRRLAAFAATSGIGLAVLVPVTKAIADRARPVVDSPVVQTPSNASFPSGHAMTALVTAGVLLLIALPAVPRRRRPWLVAGTGALVLLIGSTRLALGVHFVSDVLAGWFLGAGWLAITTSAFRAWQHDRGRRPDEPLDPLDVPAAEAPHLSAAPDQAPDQDPDRGPAARATALRLAGLAAVLFLCASALGLLVTRALTDTWLGRLDRNAVAFFVDLRSPGLTEWMQAVSTLSGTRAVIAVGLTLAVLGIAVSASWRPVVFVVVTIVSEVGIYVATAQVVGRLRPAVPDLTTGLPVGASWPSGHVAAAAAVYGAAAALVVAQGRGRLRWAVVALPVLLAPLIGISRIYVAAHHPTDVLAGLLVGGVWVYVCARVLLSDCRPDPRPGPAARPAPAGRPRVPADERNAS